MKTFLFGSLLFLNLITTSQANSETIDLERFRVSFAESMGKSYNFPQLTKSFQCYESFYNRFHFLKVRERKPRRFKAIPKIIHQIWIGPKKLPKKCIPLMKSWTRLHPDWEYKLWNNEDLKSFKCFSGRAISSSKNIGSKVDILKYEILYRYGGVYIDADFESLQPLDILVENSKFFVGLFANDIIGNGIIGSIAQHPILKTLLEFFKKTERLSRNNPLKQTGPYIFSKYIKSYLNKNPNDPLVVYPTSFFHPYPINQRNKYWKGNWTTEKLRKHFAKPETFAIHYWANAWK